jgi:hypothetical protein
LLGEAPATGGSFADTDGDGISDEVEAANTALGFNPAVSNGTPATIFDGLYTESSILDLLAMHREYPVRVRAVVAREDKWERAQGFAAALAEAREQATGLAAAQQQ